jgi:glycosyltransferase involved in cell wall biosynthesis
MLHSTESVLFVVRGDATFPSSRFRFHQFVEPLRALGVRVDVLPIERNKAWRAQVRFQAALVTRARGRQAVVFQKLLEPWRIRLLRLGGAPVFYDFDDAMYLESETLFRRTVRAADQVIAGNATLAARAQRYTSRVTVVPTTVPVPEFVPRVDRTGPLRLSWIGTRDNLRYLAPVLDAVERLHHAGLHLDLRVVTDAPERVPVRPGVAAERWSPERERQELEGCHVGLMPLADDDWSRGKCACKALQYLSFGKPVLSSPVGLNKELFASGSFGALVCSDLDWGDAIRRFTACPDELTAMGQRGYEFVKREYSIATWAPRLRHILLGSR